MATQSRNSNIGKFFGPGGAKVATCSFSLVGATLTTVEAQGCTVVRSGVGTYVVSLGRAYKNITVGMSVECAAGTAQLFFISARDLAAGTITLKQATAGGASAVDTATARIDLVIVCRSVA